MATASPAFVLHIVNRLMAHWRNSEKYADSVAEDWARKLSKFPASCIWQTYDGMICEDRPFPPVLGQFLEKVQAKSDFLKILSENLGIGGKHA